MEGARDTNLRFIRISGNAFVPRKGSPGSAGYDLFASSGVQVPPRGRACVPTDLIVSVPEGTYGRIAPRSGLAWQHFIDVGAGVIDSDFRGPLVVLLFNHQNLPFVVRKGDRIAQLICEKIVYPQLLEVEYFDDTRRGRGGFGSTGKN